IGHLHWVFGWWEWMIIILFMTANVWRMKPWTIIKLPQPWKGIISFVFNVIFAYLLALLCIKLIPTWVNMEEVTHHLPAGDAGNPTRFFWYHAAEIAGFTLIPFLAWHHYFDDMIPMADKDSWGAFWFRTIGVLVLMVITYIIYYVINFGHWGSITCKESLPKDTSTASPLSGISGGSFPCSGTNGSSTNGRSMSMSIISKCSSGLHVFAETAGEGLSPPLNLMTVSHERGRGLSPPSTFVTRRDRRHSGAKIFRTC